MTSPPSSNYSLLDNCLLPRTVHLSPSIYSVRLLLQLTTAFGNPQKHVHARGNLEGDAFMLLFPTRILTNAFQPHQSRILFSVLSIRIPASDPPAKAIRQEFFLHRLVNFLPRSPTGANIRPLPRVFWVLGLLGSHKAVAIRLV
jgi:hypothetical protein